MTGNVNRVNEEIAQWQEKEKELARLFPEQVRNSKEALRNSLNYYKSIVDKYKLTHDPAEKRSLLMVKALRRELENKIYPSLLGKLFIALKELVFRGHKQEAAEVINFRNELKLRNDLAGYGFGDLQSEIARQVRLNQPEFSIPLSWTVNGQQQINFNLQCQRNRPGEYEFIKYTGALQQGKEYVKQTFDVSERISPMQAYNLLSGRAVEKEYVTPGGEYFREWKQLDLNDRDQAGNHKMITVKHDKVFDVAGEINELVEKGIVIAPSAKTIIDGICDGNNQYVLFKGEDQDKVVYIKADAVNRSLKYSNEKMEPVTLIELLGKSMSVVRDMDNSQEKSLENKQGLKI